MSRLVFDKISSKGNFKQPFIERVYLVSGLDNAVSAQNETVDGIQVDISFYFPAIGADRLQSPSAILNALSGTRIMAACVYGIEENNKIIQDSSIILNYVVESDTSVSNWVTAGMASYKPDRHSPNPGAQVTPLQLESSYVMGSITVEHISGLRNFESVSMADLEEILSTENSLFFNDTKYFKFTTSITIPMSFSADQDITTFEQLMDIVTDEYKYMNVYVFTMPLDWMSLSDESRKEYRINKFFTNKLTGNLTYQNVIKDGIIVPNEEVSFVTLSGEIVDTPVVRSLQGIYKSIATEALQEIVEEIQNFPSGSEDSNIREQYDSLNVLVETNKDSTELLTQLNQYRKYYPYKNDTDIGGSFYTLLKNATSELISYTNTGETVMKSITLTPVVIDSRTETISDEYDEPVTIPTELDGKTESAGRFVSAKNYITRYAYSSANNAGTSLSSTSDTFTWEEEDIICDYGYIFFDYEKALRNDTVLSSLLNIDKLQLYFGKQFINGTLALLESKITKNYVVNTGTATGNRLQEAKYMKTNYLHWKDSNFGPYACTRFITDSSYYDPVGVDYKADIGMNGQTDYSYVSLRNIQPVARFASSRYDASSSTVKQVQKNSFEEDYRLMCFYFQDYYGVSLADETITSVDGVDYTEQNYSLLLTFNDQSTQALNALRNNFEDYIINSDYGLETYYNYAIETGNNNNYTGFFNDFFINGITKTYEDDPNSAPWITVPIIYNIHRDILLDTFNGDSEALLRDAENSTAKIAPKTGTLEQLEIYLGQVQSLFDQFYGIDGLVPELIFSFVSEMDTDGIREVKYFHEIQTLPDIIHAGETYEEYLSDIESAPAYPVENSTFSLAGVGGDYPSSAASPSYDTSTLYSRAELEDDINTYFKLRIYLLFIDWADTASSVVGTGLPEQSRSLLQLLLEPGSDISTYYKSLNDKYFINMMTAGGSLESFETLWYNFVIDGEPGYATLYPSAADLDESDLGLPAILEFMARRIFAAANYSESVYGSAAQITDFYEFLSVDDSYRTTS